MDLKDNMLQRIDELLEEPRPSELREKVTEIALATVNMIATLYGPQSAQLNFLKTIEKQIPDEGWQSDWNVGVLINHLHGCLRTLKADILEGRIVDLQSEAQREVLGDFIALARKALIEEQKDVAAVLACAALEDALKRCANDHNLDVDDKDMSDVVNALKSAGVIRGPQGSLLKGFVQLRNKTFHAQWEALDVPDIKSILAFTEEFLVKQFSPQSL